MSELLEHIARFKQSGDASVLVDVIPYARFLGLALEVHEGRVLARMRYSDHLIGNPALPALHGGTTGALLESVSIFQLLWEAETIVLPKTINITVSYLRSGRPQDTLARATIIKHGRRVVAVAARAWQTDPDKPIATANTQLLIADRPSP